MKRIFRGQNRILFVLSEKNCKHTFTNIIDFKFTIILEYLTRVKQVRSLIWMQIFIIVTCVTFTSVTIRKKIPYIRINYLLHLCYNHL